MHTINLSGREVAEASLTRRLKLAEEASIKIDVIDLVDEEEDQAKRSHQPLHRPPEVRRSDDNVVVNDDDDDEEEQIGRDCRVDINSAITPRLSPFVNIDLSSNANGEVLFRNGSLSGERRTYSRRPIHASPDSTSSSSERARGRLDHQFKPTPSSTHSKASAGSCIIFNRSYVKTPTSSSTPSGISPTRYSVFDRAPMTALTDRRMQLTRNAFQRAGGRPSMLSGSSDTSTSIHGSPIVDITGRRDSESPLPRVSLLRRSYHKSSGESAASSTHHPVVTTIDLDSDCSPVRSNNHQTATADEVEDGSTSSEGVTVSNLPRQHPLIRDECMEVAEDAPEVEFVGIDIESTRADKKVHDPIVESQPNDSQTEGDEPDQQDDEGSSMENSYGDVSSSGCVKFSSTRHSMGRQGVTEASRSNSMNEFELKLQEINEWVKPMTHRDRVEHWRVTEEDLRHSIPTKAKIETTSYAGTKRAFYDTVHISSEDDSSDDSPIEGISSSMTGTMLASKKRRTADAMEASTSGQLRTDVMNGLATDRAACAGTSATTTLSLDDGEDSDFRNGQLNPEIDKPQTGTSMLLIRRTYHKLSSGYSLCKRCNKCSPTEPNDGVPVQGIETYCDCRRAIETINKGPNVAPYAQLLCRDRGLDSFLNYLRISPLHRTNQLAGAPVPPPNCDDVKTIGVVLAPGSKVELDVQSITKSTQGIDGTAKSKLNTQRRANQGKRRVVKSKKKVTAKSKSHPGTIASSAIRGVRRLVLSSSLRSGKVIRYRTTFPSLRQPPKQGKACTSRITAVMAANSSCRTPTHDEGTTEPKPISRDSEPGDASDVPSQQHLDSPVHIPPMTSSSSSSSSMTRKPKPKSLHRTAATASLRCSVDSAVSSSTSAEMHEGKRSKECQTVESALALEAMAEVECPADPPPKPVNEGIPCRNPLNRSDGEVLHVFLIDEKLIVVQTGLVSFWRYSRLSALLGVRQEWERVAQVSRWLRDTELDTENAHRIGYNNCHPFYLEPRARNLAEDESRTCPLASIYINAYFLITKIHMLNPATPSGDEGEQNITETNDDEDGRGSSEDHGGVREEDVARVKSYQLDTVKSTLEDVLFLPIPNSRYFIVCWYEHVREMESKTGLCKYSLTPDLETLASIREFPSVRQKLNSLRCLPNSRLLGLGESTVHLWCYETGHLLWTIDLKLSLGTIVGSFVHRETVESTLFLFQIQPVVNESNRKLMKVIAVNLFKKAWYVAHSYEIALSSMRITGESQLAEPTQEGNQRHCVTFQSGELLLVSLNTPSFCWTNHRRLAKDLLHAEEYSVRVCSRLRSNTGDVYRPKERIQNAGYWHGGRDLLLLGDQCLTIKSIDEYMAESAR
ncbi:hypothetical protein AND_000059 [Anopheles darlingi]|uniref:Uncharacterized protein n=1 Tax=Anopheles darlingi TaxID=43151 RepID=W5JUS6_ANODA|nr:hypothetical protein AND_000059 [Anopheles darlingi]